MSLFPHALRQGFTELCHRFPFLSVGAGAATHYYFQSKQSFLRVARHFVPPAVTKIRAHRAAQQQFMATQFVPIEGLVPETHPSFLKRVKNTLFTMRPEKAAPRLIWIGLIFLSLYGTIAGRVIYLGLKADDTTGSIRHARLQELTQQRPSLVDRNGEILAADVKAFSIYAEPRKLVDKDEAVELLNAVFPELNGKELRDKLSVKRNMPRNHSVLIKREISPKEKADVHRLGLPGLFFMPEHKRVYPNGMIAGHVIGYTGTGGVGLAGMEKYLDTRENADLKDTGFAKKAMNLNPVELALDLRVNHILRDELDHAKTKFKAIATAGLILDVNTGEIIAQASLPDYDPASPPDPRNKDYLNRLGVGVYEMGSTFKAMTTAMALDSGKVTLHSSFDARMPLRYGRFNIKDYHAQRRVLSVPEIFTYSSNIGTARMALAVGVEGHKAFLRKMGQLTRLRTELPESSEPIVPQHWGELNTMTISFGHGLAVAPLQAAMATAALMNGGWLMPPTYLKRSQSEARAIATRVVKGETSDAMRYIMRLNAVQGSAKNANVPGFMVGGKTGTAEKIVNGRYSKDKVFTTFFAVFPADKPRYLVLTMLDEPKGLPETHGFATSGWNAAPTTGKIIERIAPMLNIQPRLDAPPMAMPLVAKAVR